MDNSKTLIKVEHVSKKFCKRLKRSLWYGVQDLTSVLLGGNKDHSALRRDEFWAVDDISFEIKKGETLGIIGPNGSGKTTLLKMLHGILRPDKGRITIKGKIGALIAVGVGFHPLLTGRENIYMNGSILGLSKDKLDEKFDDIIAFADIGDFLDMPIGNYSSGMLVRLGFAVAIHCEPDILLIDEILSVGDIGFRLKSINRIKEMMEWGVTTIFVSHNMNPVRAICDKVIALDGGKIAVGPTDPDRAIEHNQALFAARRLHKGFNHPQQRVPDNQLVAVTSIDLLDGEGRKKSVFSCNEEFRVRVGFIAHEKIENPGFGVEIKREDGIVCCLDRSHYHNFTIDHVEGEGFFEMIINGLFLAPMNYSTRVVITDFSVSLTIASKLGPDFTVTSHVPYSYNGIFFPQSFWKAGCK